MILQAEAERKKRANMIESEGDRQSRINLAEAQRSSQILRSEGAAEAVIARAQASANALKSIKTALDAPKGQDAANFLLGERYIEAYSQIGKSTNTIIMHSEPQLPIENVSASFNLLAKLEKKEINIKLKE